MAAFEGLATVNERRSRKPVAAEWNDTWAVASDRYDAEAEQAHGSPAGILITGTEHGTRSETTAKHVQRYVVVAGPEAVAERCEFEISAALLRELSHDILYAPPVDVMLTVDEKGHSTGAPAVTVVIYASPAFEVLSDSKVELDVIPDSDPEPAVFRLCCKPDVSGPQELNVVLLQGWRVLGEVKLVVKVGVHLLQAKQLRQSLTVPAMPPDIASPPDVVIRVSCITYQGRDTLHYKYEWLAQGWPSVDAGSVELRGTADEWLREKLQELGEAARRSVAADLPLSAGNQSSAERESRRYEVIGENLYRELFTGDLRAF